MLIPFSRIELTCTINVAVHDYHAARASWRMILLDTHVLVWAVTAEVGRLPPAAIDEIDRAAEEGHVAVSAATFWELEVKRRKSRTNLPTLPPVKDLRSAVLERGLSEVAVSGDLWGDAVSLLDEAFHPDPADQLIVATAVRHEWELATMDRRITDWAHRTQRLKLHASGGWPN